MFAPFFREKFQKHFLTDEDTLIVLDTNYLLSILRLSPELAIKYIRAIRDNEKNIYIPYIAALEFNFNKINVKYNNKKNIKQIDTIIQEIENQINSSKKKLEKILLNDQQNRISQHADKYIETLHTDLESFQKIDRQKKADEVYESLINAISTKVGDKPTQEKIDLIEAEGEERYEKEISPGYNDAKNKLSSRQFDGIEYQRKYGDLLIWKDIIDKSKELSKKRVIFVTDDGTSEKKTDLFYEINKNKMGPRIEMMDELYKNSKADLYILRNEAFVSETVELNDQQMQEIRNLNVNKAVVQKDNMNNTENLIELINDDKNLITQKKSELANLNLKNLLLTLNSQDESIAEKMKDNEIRLDTLKSELKDLENHYQFLKAIYRTLDNGKEDDLEF